MKEQKTRFESIVRSKIFSRILSKYCLGKKKILDLGCGYGQYLTHFGSGSTGVTTNKDEVAFGVVHNLDIRFGNVENFPYESLGHFDVIWANNLFEHLLSPHKFLVDLKKVSNKETLLILGVPVIPKLSFLLRFSKFRGSLASNHINFFFQKTLNLTVERAGWRVITSRPFISSFSTLDWLLSLIAPHVYVVATMDSEFTYPNKKFLEWKDDTHYDSLLKSTGQK